MDNEKSKSGLSNKQLNAILETSTNGGGLACHFFGFTKDLSKTQFALPTAEMYAKLQTTGFFSREYEDLRREYEDLRRPFNNIHQLTDVIKHSQESHLTKYFDHDTVKPLGLMEKLIATITSENEIILDPFAGSGTTLVAAKNLNRRAIGCELHEPYYEIAKARIENAKQQQDLF